MTGLGAVGRREAAAETDAAAAPSSRMAAERHRASGHGRTGYSRVRHVAKRQWSDHCPADRRIIVFSADVPAVRRAPSRPGSPMRCLAICQDELVIKVLDEILLPSFRD